MASILPALGLLSGAIGRGITTGQAERRQLTTEDILRQRKMKQEDEATQQARQSHAIAILRALAPDSEIEQGAAPALQPATPDMPAPGQGVFKAGGSLADLAKPSTLGQIAGTATLPGSGRPADAPNRYVQADGFYADRGALSAPVARAEAGAAEAAKRHEADQANLLAREQARLDAEALRASSHETAEDTRTNTRAQALLDAARIRGSGRRDARGNDNVDRREHERDYRGAQTSYDHMLARKPKQKDFLNQETYKVDTPALQAATIDWRADSTAKAGALDRARQLLEQARGAPAPAGGAPSAGVSTASYAQMEQEMAQATAHYKALLTNPRIPRPEADAAYQADLHAISQRYGQP